MSVREIGGGKVTQEMPSTPLDYKLLFETAPGLYVVLDSSLHVVEASNAYLAAAKKTRQELLGRALFEVFTDQSEGASNLRASFRRVIERRAPDTMAVQKYFVPTPEDPAAPEERYWNAINSPVLDDNGEIRFIIHHVQDVTDLMRLGSQAKSQFLANMSHEIRTPLGVILGFAELLHDPNLTRAERDDFVHRIFLNGQHLLELIGKVLDLSKIEAGKIEVELADVSIPRVLQEITELLEPLAGAKGVQIRFTLEGGLPTEIRTDKTKLRQILLNLVGNSVKFSRSGLIEVKAMLHYKKGAPEVMFAVKDHGPGIDPSFVPHLFESFSQGDPSMTRRQGGTGLGLALSRKLARVMQGDLWLDKSDATETIFSFSVPLLIARDEVVAPTPSFEARRDLEGKHVLLIDDSSENRMIVDRFLERAGAIVTTAPDGSEGIRKTLEEHPDVVLMDIQMPIVDGYAATKEIREKGYKGPIIALTAHALKEDRERAMRAGCDGYLTKPLTSGALIGAITTALERASGPSPLKFVPSTISGKPLH